MLARRGNEKMPPRPGRRKLLPAGPPRVRLLGFHGGGVVLRLYGAEEERAATARDGWGVRIGESAARVWFGPRSGRFDGEVDSAKWWDAGSEKERYGKVVR